MAFTVFGHVISFAQEVEITPGNDTTLCTNQTLALTAVIDPSSSGGGSTSFVGYDYDEIPVSAGPTVGTNVTLTDDSYSNAINIGFPFQFFGTNYSQLYISSNGWVGFNAPLTGDYTPEDFPTCDGPDLGILACWQDFNPGTGGSVTYTTTGVAPNRRFVVSYNNIPFFGGTCPGLTSNFQIQLYETSNIIEIHIINKPACAGLWGTGAVTGIVGANNANPCNCYYIENEFNNTNGAINNRAFRYTPIIGNLNGVDAVLQSLQWSVNGTNVGTTNSPNYTAFMLNTTQSRTVIVTATFSIPCVGNVVVRDTVVISPGQYDPTFTVTSPICAGQETALITFVGSPIPPANATIAWNFDGGVAVPGTGLGPHDVSWPTSGNKNVSLNISGGSCAAASFDTIVEVVPSPTSAFTATSEVCGAAAATLAYTGNAPASANYTWNFDGGVAVPANGQGPFSVTWATPGLKNVSLTVGIGSCVSSVTTLQVNVLPPPVSSFIVSSPSVCEGSPVVVTFTGLTPASANYTWNFDGGVSVPVSGQGPFNVTWASSGQKNITLQVNDNGCISPITTVPVTVNAIPSATFNSTPAVCPGANATVTYSGSANASASFNWSWDSGTANSGNGIGPHTVNWPSAGQKSISLTVTQNGCVSEPFAANVTVNPIPTSAFTANPSGVCVGATTSLTYTGTASPAATYAWNFNSGDALPGGNVQGPQAVSWNTQGLKNISLIVTENGCSSTQTSVSVDVFPTPSATFTVTSAVCPGDIANVNYTGSGTAAATYTWNFDGGVSVPPPPGAGPYDISWNSSGNKAISLVVSENGCASQPFSQTVEVYQIPSSVFTASSPICAGETTTLNYTGGAGASSIFNWTLPGGSPAALAGSGPHSVEYSTEGSYFLNLTVTENGCVSNPTQVQVTVNPIPTSDFVSDGPVCLDGFAEVVYTGNAPLNSIYNWNFGGGDATSSNGQGPILIRWNTPGPKTVSLNVNALGCQSEGTTDLIINVLPLPSVNAGTDVEVCSGALAQIGSAGDVTYTYAWSPSTGLTDPLSASTSVQLMNNTTNTIAYNYILTANDGSCEASDTVNYSVTAPPFVSFASPSGQCFDGHSFNFVAQGDFTPTADFIWNFGPNAVTPSSSVVNPSNITFDSTGSQTISLQVDDGGCFSNLYVADVVIYKEPEADFYSEVTSGCEPLVVKFINISEGPANMQYEWNFGSGQPSASEQPSYTYVNPGIYDVSLNVKTINGCTSSLDRKEYINVYPTPIANFKMSALSVNIIEPEITFNSTAEFADSIWYSIQFSDTTIFADTTLFGDSITFYFPELGEYNITQFVENQFNCVDTAYNKIEVITGYRIYIPNSFSPNDDGTNDFFRPYGEGLSSFEIKIWNRWGQQIYASFDIENGWDGKAFLADDFVPSGVYL
ncbi:MAG: PKD domain-containing protein, partial [Bacteroidia bacterium]